MSSRTFWSDDNLTDVEWSTPIRITGDDGKAGTDGNSIEFIYYQTNDPDEDNVPAPDNIKEDEYVPKYKGWTDSPSGVNEEFQWEYFALRRKVDGSWSNWSEPALWSKYGVNGQDGDGVEYVYARTNSETTKPTLTIPSDWDDPHKPYQSETEYIPSNTDDKGEKIWSDNPKGVEDVDGCRVEWVSSRKYYAKAPGERKMWQQFSEPTVWAKFSKDGQDGAPGKDGVDGAPGKDGQDGKDGAPGKLGKVTYPAGKYDNAKEYTSTDVKAPYVMVDEEYYLLKESIYWSNGKCYYSKDHKEKDSSTYKYLSINPEDIDSSNTVTGTNDGNGVKFWCAEGCTNSNFNSKWNLQKPSLSVAKTLLVNGKKYIKQFYKSNVFASPGYIGHVVWTLNPEKTEVILASKFIYSTDGTPGTIKSSISAQTPAQNVTSPVGLKVWEKFESFEAIYAKIGIIENGTIGSAVYSGDFMFSQQGVDKNGNTSTSYQNFNPSHIYDSESTFKPNICMNFKTGEMYVSCGKMNFLGGDVYMNGFIRRNETNINCTNFSTIKNFCNTNNFTSSDGPYGIMYTYELDLEKTGSCIILNYETNKSFVDDNTIVGFYLPSTSNDYFDDFNDTEKKEYMKRIRSYVGNTIYIYNKLPNKDITIVGINGGKGMMLESNRVAKLDLIWVDNGNSETYNWISSDKTIRYDYTDSPMITCP